MDIVRLEPDGGPQYPEGHWQAPKMPFRMVVVGPSNSGKTNAVLNVLLRHLKYDHLYMYSRHASQGKMRLLTDFFGHVKEALVTEGKGLVTEADADMLTVGSKLSDVIPVDSLEDNDDTRVVVFDDYQTERDQSIIEDYFVRGRHKRCSVIYIAQTWFKVPRVVRLNASHVMLYKLSSGSEANALCRELGLGVTKAQFMEMYERATEQPYHFLFIDLDTSEKLLKFRRDFNQLWWPAGMPDPPHVRGN